MKGDDLKEKLPHELEARWLSEHLGPLFEDKHFD